MAGVADNKGKKLIKIKYKDMAISKIDKKTAEELDEALGGKRKRSAFLREKALEMFGIDLDIDNLHKLDQKIEEHGYISRTDWFRAIVRNRIKIYKETRKHQ